MNWLLVECPKKNLNLNENVENLMSQGNASVA